MNRPCARLIEERLLAVWQGFLWRPVLEVTPNFEQTERDRTTELRQLLPPTWLASGD